MRQVNISYLHEAFLLCRMNSSEGLPLKRQSRSSCFILSAPGNSGMRPISSATMQPTAHISTAEVYLCHPTSTSGARYQRVVTYSVIASILESLLSLYTLASPKSATLRQQSPFTRRFRGLFKSMINLKTTFHNMMIILTVELRLM